MRKLKIPRYIQWIGLTAIFFLIVMSLLRLAMILSFKSPAGSTIPYTDVFILGFRYDLRDACIISLILFLLGSIKPLHPFDRKLGRAVALSIWLIAIIVFTLFYVFDFANYAYLSQRLTASILTYLHDTKISMGMIWQTYPVFWIVLGILIFIAFLIAMVRLIYNFMLSRKPHTSRASRLVWGVVFFIFLGLGIFGRAGQFPLRWSDAFIFNNDYASNMSLNPFQSFFSSLDFKVVNDDPLATKKYYALMSNYLGVTHPDSSALNYERVIQPSIDSSQIVQPNIVLVICESFSAYKSSMYGNPLNTTPYFNELCKTGIFFDRFFTPSYGTARGVWATLTGIPDVEIINTSSRNPQAVDQRSIINAFKGYEKYYFIGGSASWANIRGLITNNINDVHLYEQDDYEAKKIDVWGISDKNLFLESDKVLGKVRQPFFAVIQTADNHRPYTIPKEDIGLFQKKKISKDSLKKYGFEDEDEYNAFRYTDFCYKQFMAAAQKNDYFKNTIFVFTGDHGIRGDAGNMFPKAWTDQGLTSEHTPFLIYAPFLLQSARYSFPASQLDILPTIAGICKIPYTNTSLGRDLLTHTDSMKNGYAFIFDPDMKRIGVLNNQYFYSYGINNSSPEQFVSMTNNQQPVLTDSLRNQFRNMTNAFYETSRYMILNNKK